MIAKLLILLGSIRRIYITFALFLILFGVGVWAAVFDAPKGFPEGIPVVVPEGASAYQIAEVLEDERVLQSKRLFLVFTRLLLASDNIHAGQYVFDRPVGPLVVALRLSQGMYGIEPIAVTFTEGMSTREMAIRVHEKFPHISVNGFWEAAGDLEGYLFPNTYLFLPTATPEYIVSTMHAQFEKEIESLEKELGPIDLPLHDVVTMASLLEKEARQYETRRIVAGILWERLRIGMALQVDAVFGYIFDRPTFSPSFTDLEVDSPYNTYKYPGLPPGPINNPGIDSIRAALTPIETEYLFYLTDADGVMRYAETFEGHRRNRALYLD